MALKTERRAKRTECHCTLPLTVVWFLGAIAAFLCIGIVALLHEGKTPDAALYTLAGTFGGGLAALLTNTGPRPAQGAPGNPLEVKAPDNEPLKTEDVTVTEPPAVDELPQDDGQAKPAAKGKSSAKQKAS